MIHPEINSAVIIPFTAFALGMIAIVCTYGRQMYRERWLEVGYPAGTIISRDVYHYFEKQGYEVFHISPIKNTTDWRFFLIKEGVMYAGVAFTDGEIIQRHEYILA